MGERVGCRAGEALQGVAVAVVKEGVLALDGEDGVLFIGPAAIVVNFDRDAEFYGAKGAFEKGIGADAIAGVTGARLQGEAAGVGCSAAAGHGDDAAWQGQGVDEALCRRFPEPVADLFMIGLDLSGLGDVGVVAQAVKELRSIGLRVDRLQADAFAVGLAAGTIGLGFDVVAAVALPVAGEGGEGAEAAQGVDTETLGFAIDVSRVRRRHTSFPMR